MWRKNDASKDELDGVAQRLRDERPTASPLELDQIKRTAMSRAKVSNGGRAFGTRRLAVAGLTVGLMAAGTGGVIAANGGGGLKANASTAEYSSNECDTNNNVGGDNNGNNNNFNCNSGTISINETNNSTTNDNSTNTNNDSSTNTTTNNYYSSTVTLGTAGTTAGSGVLASKQTSVAKSARSFSVHFFAAKGRKLKKLTIRLNGKIIKVLTGGNVATTLDFVGVKCTNVKQNLTLTGTLSNGKKITETRHYNLCQG